MPPRESGSPSKSAPPPPPLPLSGAIVFLHIRDAAGVKATRKSKKSGNADSHDLTRSANEVRRECRQLVEQLGASLTISEAAATLVVGRHATPAFVDSCAAAGKAVVTPQYLMACAEVGRRLDVRDYLLASPPPAVADGSPVAASPSRAAKRTPVKRTPTAARGKGPRREEGSTSPPSRKNTRTAAPVVAAHTVKLRPLADDEKKVGEQTKAEEGTAPPRTLSAPLTTRTSPTAEGGRDVEELSSSSRDTVAVTPPQSLAISPAPCTPLFSSLPDNRDTIRHAVLRSTVAARQQRKEQQRSTEGPLATTEGAGSGRRRRPHSQARDPFLGSGNSADSPSPSSDSTAATRQAQHNQEEGQPHHNHNHQLLLESTSLSTPSLVPSCSVTQTLSPPAAPPPPPPLVTAAAPASGPRPPQRTREGSKNARKATTRAGTPAAAAVATGKQRQRQRQATGQPKASSSSSAATAPAPPASPSLSESPLLPMHFTEAAQLRRVDSHPGSDFRVALILREDDGQGGGAGQRANASSAQACFLADVVEQLGGSVVSTETIFGRHRKPTHLVVDDLFTDRATAGQEKQDRAGAVDERVGLTPGILLAKALGIHIVRPQWLYDAIALGGFPEVLPSVHSHPVFGQERSVRGVCEASEEEEAARERKKREAEEVEERRVAEAVAAAAALARREREEAETAHDVLGIASTPPPTPTGEEMPSHGPPTTTMVAVAAAAAASSTTVRGSSTASGHGNTNTKSMIAFLTRTTRDEVMPVGQLWERPFYKPIFANTDFFLKIDKAKGGSGRGATSATSTTAATRRKTQKREEESATVLPTSSSTLLLSSDEAEAFEQATELIRVLGGAVTRTRDSHHIDIVLDLYGFCPPAAATPPPPPSHRLTAAATTTTTVAALEEEEKGMESAQAGKRKRGRAGEHDDLSLPPAPPQSIVMESMSSLSMAYQEALARIGSYADGRHLPPRQQQHAGELSDPDSPHDNGDDDHPDGRSKPSDPGLPTVGVPWLVHCVLQREKSDVGPFLLSSPSEGGGHKTGRGTNDTSPTAAEKNGWLPTTISPSPQQQTQQQQHEQQQQGSPSPLVLSSSSPSPPPPPASMPQSSDLFTLPSQVDLMAKTTAGPATAMKRPEEQLDTQQIHEVLDG